MRIIIHSTHPYDPFFDIDADADMVRVYVLYLRVYEMLNNSGKVMEESIGSFIHWLVIHH